MYECMNYAQNQVISIQLKTRMQERNVSYNNLRKRGAEMQS